MQNYMLDLFDPHQIIERIVFHYNGGDTGEGWKSTHIRAMLHMCDYIRNVYPHSYKHVEDAYEHFLTLECNDLDVSTNVILDIIQ